jgi:DinB superfamily
MTRKSLEQQWDQLRQKYSLYLHLLDTIPANRFHTRIVQGMGTPAELVVQMSAAIVRDIAQGVANGEIKPDRPREARIVADLGTKAAVIEYARKCWDLADDAVRRIDSEQLNATIPTPWNLEIPGWVGFSILNDEFVHHYGQLYTYARLCGAEPPFLWGFAESARQYRFVD